MLSMNAARLVLIEARRGALPWLAAGAVASSIGLAAFLSQVALTDSRSLQLAAVAALVRLFAVFLTGAHVAASVVRDMNDKALELMLTLPAARASHYVGRLAGYVACGAILAVLFAAPLLLWAGPAAVALWGLSLALECALVAAAALFFAVSLGQVVAAVATTAALYVLARSITAIQAIAATPLAEVTTGHEVAQWAVRGVALLLPRLDAVTRTDWLLYGLPAPQAYALALAGLVAYGTLLVAAGLFDFQRESY